MTEQLNCDILVVGGGLTGTAVALGLEKQGWQVILVEAARTEELTARPAPAVSVETFEPRVSALSVASQRLLERLGGWPSSGRDDRAEARFCPYRRMVVWDGDGTGRIRFDAAEMQVPALGVIVENRLVVRALFQAALNSSMQVIDGAQVSGWWEEDNQRGIHLADGRRITAPLTVAADGANSRLRHWAGLPTREWDYEQQAIVCTAETAQHHDHTAWQRFSRTGPLAFLPLACDSPGKNGHFSSIVWSQDNLEAQRLMALDDAAFRSELGGAIEQQLGAVNAVSRRFAFPLRQRHARDYVRPGMALVGDAAHTIHPLAGQGANLGFGDVRVLLDELARARSRNLGPDVEIVLARYQRRRKGENLAMMASMEGFKTLFGRDELPVRWLRNTGMRWLDGSDAIKRRIAAEAMGLGR